MKTRVKICCISSKEEAQQAIKYGASGLGLVGNMPSGPGIIGDDLIKDITQIIPPTLASFLLTSETTSETIIQHYKKVYTNTIQLVDELKNEEYQILRNELPWVKLVQVIHVIDENSVTEAIEKSQFVDAILLDSGNPNLQVKELGGTGRTHNWAISKKIREEINIPLFLAGGLHPDNIREAIDVVQPFGVDICSGVRTDGKLDEKKLDAFFRAVNG
ncbi:phosphoribosylanthranilate isomerase [Empedobacter falsenii]|uniref:N-(5'-phosphoribosyl)anthranilate isomerase n=2 Tax=Weeksellaceae TaxID=2762318 RepID=A0A427BPV9_9FLAO|nr:MULTISPECIES: phosphoribosylanthranilate isomerase [unclassified Empedobacter]MDH0658870.1 phosphoribosylanthranilate isomerase [Empedobacter sp. GD03865]RRT92216.1 phosphoribosylanthranilate isomerase [Empedobacter falsenii]RRT92300.1 phosphoribosylanthranilate isomerase [Empedobacter falsenii]